MREKMPDRFWNKMDIKGDDDCWCWLYRRSKKGYGQFNYYGKIVDAQRVAWELTYGKIPDFDAPFSNQKICVLHTCDNPPCCNPSHLFLGTNKDNVIDRNSKNRQHRAIGELNGRAKLTTADIMKIKQLRDTGLKYTSIARMFGVTSREISYITKGVHWKST